MFTNFRIIKTDAHDYSIEVSVLNEMAIAPLFLNDGQRLAGECSIAEDGANGETFFYPNLKSAQAFRAIVPPTKLDKA